MAKINKMQKIPKFASRRVSPFSLRSRSGRILKNVHHKKYLKLEKKEWKQATCSVCMEHPHNAVLLLCSSYNKGCRPYMCATGTRYSNCLGQYKKAYSTQVHEPLDTPTLDPGSDFHLAFSNRKSEKCELLCPLCRGQVKGWTVIEPARKYLNTKRRTCTQDNCSFVGTYKELKNHVKAEHPWACPREVDPTHAEKWKRLEREREHQDVISTIRSSMPGAVVVGDYVIERPHSIFSSHRGNSGDGNRYLTWDEECVEMDQEGVEMDQEGGAALPGNLDNYLLSRLSDYGNRALARRPRRRRRISSNRS